MPSRIVTLVTGCHGLGGAALIIRSPDTAPHAGGVMILPGRQRIWMRAVRTRPINNSTLPPRNS
jgi:hypothetical protein